MGFSGTLFQSYAQISSTVPAACASLCPSDSSGAPQAGPRLEFFLLAHPTHTHLEKKQNPVRGNNLQKILGVAELLYTARPSEKGEWEW
jgi:hypothetical protein